MLFGVNVRILMWVILLLGAAACRKTERSHEGVAPPPVNRPTPAVCAGSESSGSVVGGKVPTRIADFCLDPNDAPRVYGEGGKRPLEDICTQLFNGECELYRSFGLAQVASVRFVADTGEGDTVNLTLSRFNTAEGSFAFYSQRILAGADPATPSVDPVEQDPRSALGAGVAYQWSGPFVAEYTFASDLLTPKQLKAKSDDVLPLFLKSLRAELGDTGAEPVPLSLLPEAELLPLGQRLHFRDALGVRDAGIAGQGHYRRGKKRYSILVAQAEYEESATDIIRTFKKSPGAHSLKDMPFGAFEWKEAQPDGLGLSAIWLFGRRGRRIAAIGDDRFALTGDKTEVQREALTLSRADKLKLLRSVLSPSN